MIIGKHIKKQYGSIEVLKGVDIHIKESEVVSIVGSSGAGKTTLLTILGTLDKPSSGEIVFNGVNITSLNEKKLAAFRNQHIGFVFQFHHLLPEFTAIENICIPAFINKISKKEAELKANKLLDLLGLTHRINHKPSELSGGEQQRVAVARALINNPKVIFADEPSGNLDSENSKLIMSLLFKYCKQNGSSLVLVTHDQMLAKECDRIIEIKDGKII